MRILLVEDDEAIVEVVTAILDAQHYVVDVATDGEAGWELVEAFPYDLVLLDIILPKLDGIAFCRKLRNQKNQVLVMLLTARDTTTDKLIGLDAGADDYLVKPFDVQELAARIRALLRRGSTVAPSVLSCGNLRLDPSACEVTHNGEILRFSRKEYLLLELFLRQQHRVFSRSAIVDQIWSFSEDPPNEDTVKSHIKSIRRKLSAVGVDDLIETLYGQGYRINPAYSSANPTPPEDPVLPKQQTLDLSVAEIWQRTQGMSLKRIAALSQFAQALKVGQADSASLEQAIQTAHKLAGSLGTFGYETGSQLARRLESLLQLKLEPLTRSVQQQLAPQVEQFMNALKAELSEIQPSSSASPSLPSTAQPNKQTALQSAEYPLVTAIDAPHPLLLILEPDRNLVENLTALATEQHLRIVTATTVDEAWNQCQQERPQVVVMNFALFQTAKLGQRLLSNLQKQPSVPIIFLSDQASSKERVEAVQAGGALFLSKPVTPDAILKAISTTLSAAESQPRVLVVDDDPLIAVTLTSCLTSQGIHLTSLEDPTQFWETLNTIQPHLLILDVNMPEINGLQLCQTIRNDPDWNWLPVLFLTAQTDSQTAQEIFRVGADDFMTKPIVPFEVSTRVFNRLRRSQSQQVHKSLVEHQEKTQFPLN
jgi:DNA-binding response OmpR family regulator/HPt (histidine-containing phosphotransfer) domain-containing protein